MLYKCKIVNKLKFLKKISFHSQLQNVHILISELNYVQAFTKSTPTSEQYAVTYDETCKQTQKWGYYNRVLRQHQNTKNKNNTKTKLHATRMYH